ncbi:MAG: stage V sporulation protein SpoVM [Oscillospiraceae bacterium]|nr:stage V sporulation protein SpoVM [Oscillospiraceae bacterium]MBP1574632.1 stage V sporulation protein SpoVM [Oscillospiraceae bacterium]MBQ5322997.1 stage V sporulation protein SpoVM [Oscillospiraceae bacterium]MBQ8594667.1 stage V sporulation protein SpoVM [Oscillospiraceae bacterium]
MFFPLTEVFVFMKIVVMNSPKFLAPFLRMIFKIGREN